MAIGHRKPGAKALLFDRLVRPDRPGRGAQTDPDPPEQFYEADGLKRSVLEQLGWLLNSRVAIDYQTLDERTRNGRRSTLDYGVPDLSSYSVGDTGAMKRLSDHLEQTITCFEPRLAHPKVVIGSVNGRNQRLVVTVSGTIAAGMIVVPVQFPIEIGATEGPRDAS